MAVERDIMIGDDGDLLFAGGDFVVDDANFHHIQRIVESGKGWWAQFPYLGADLSDTLKGTMDARKIQEIRINLEADGFQVKSIKVKDGQIDIQAKK